VFSRIGTATKTVAGTFSSTSGDYFHRTVPWNPVAINSSCPNTVVIDSTANPELASACLTANDAPNGRPATVSGMVKVNTSGAANVAPSAYGQVAFNDQISAWCSACHSRYYSSTNPNPGTDPGSSDFPARSIASIDLPSDAITVGPTITNADGTTSTITSSGYAVGDMVQFVATPTAPNLSSGTWYVVYIGSSATSDALSFKVSATYDGPVVDITGWSGGGTVVRLAPASASSWWFPRPNEPIYKYQHQTTTNRACVTCHVSHGSNAAMPGDQSGVVTYPGDPSGSLTTVGYNSRLLKVDNRGTCQMCHDPTGTWTAGQFLPLNGTPPTVP
jgi:cytochrome c553